MTPAPAGPAGYGPGMGPAGRPVLGGPPADDPAGGPGCRSCWPWWWCCWPVLVLVLVNQVVGTLSASGVTAPSVRAGGPS